MSNITAVKSSCAKVHLDLMMISVVFTAEDDAGKEEETRTRNQR